MKEKVYYGVKSYDTAQMWSVVRLDSEGNEISYVWTYKSKETAEKVCAFLNKETNN